ncbi:MAG TPA: hypothetical protein VGB95_07425 [Chitinophagales bacterium]
MHYGKLLLFIVLSVFVVDAASAQKAKKGKVENDPWAAYEAEKNKMVDDNTDTKKEEKVDTKKTTSKSTKSTPAKKPAKAKVDKNAPKSNTQFNTKKGVEVEVVKDSATLAREKVEEYLKIKAQQGAKRPTVKPQDIKDPIDRTMKGPTGENVYKSSRGGRYYIDNIGAKTYLTPDK